MRESWRKGHPTLAVGNVVGSTIAREADGGVFLHAGSEIGVASTKAFTAWLRRTLECEEDVKRTPRKYASATSFLYLGRQFLYPVALEGALKLKDISYIHAEGYPAAEMKHGPIAMVEKVMSNLEEIKARGGPVIAFISEGDHAVGDLADVIVVAEYLQPLVTTVLAYHALVLGCDVNTPRNLAKSVTVK